MKKLTNDHRTRVTKMLIRKAFTSLLVQKPIQNISIKELCEIAGINRGTFYGHYTDIYDLRTQIEDEMYAEFELVLTRLLKTEQQLTPVRVTTELFQFLKDNSDWCVVTLGEFADKDFLLKMIATAREKCVETYSKFFQGISPKKIEYFYAFISSGCLGLLRQWMANGMTASAEEMAHMTEEIILYGIGFLQKS